MSEEILNAIIYLLGVVAKEDEITLSERASIENFLRDTLDEETAKTYLNRFDQIIANLSASGGDEVSKIKDYCERINLELTGRQKVIVLLSLLELIAADGLVSKRESELLYLISESLNIQKRITDLIKAFVIFQERTKIISSNILIIDNGEEEVPSKCRRLVHSGMQGFVFVLRVPDVDVYLAKYVGTNDLIINGIPMRSNRIYNLASGAVIKPADTDPIYHSEVVNCFRQTPVEQHLTFVARNITYKFRNGKIGLRNIHIEEEGGRLVALMGGSGAGKSTLLNVLNGNERPTEGMVRINGVDIHVSKEKIEGVIGYVPQDDLLIEELSVYDNLYFAARLCFKDMSDGDLDQLVNRTLESLGLYETRNLKVGSTLEKTISGGQRKRLNIGLELLREPSVLFVDEPTSGLSSRDSENIMDLLKELSLKGKMIFVVIHQPSSEIFKMFDKLVILDVGGYQIYYGNPVEGISYFKEMVKMVDPSRGINPEQIFNIIESRVVNEYGNFTPQRKTSPYQWYQYFQQHIRIPKITETTAVPPKTLHIPNKIKQLGIFSLRDLKTKLSNRQYLLVNLLEAPALALLLAFIVRYLPEDTDTYHYSENLNIPIFFFMSVIVALFMGLTVSAEEIIKDRKILKREEFLNLSRMSYLVSKTGILFLISAIQTLTFVWVGSWILEIKGLFWQHWAILFSLSCFANVLGLNISSAFKSAVTVYILIPLIVIPQLILSGVVVNFDKLNPIITNEDKVPLIGEIMATRWAFEALAVTSFKDNPFTAQFYPADKVMADSEFKSGYYFPRLEADLEFARSNMSENSVPVRKEVAYKLATVRKELEKMMALVGTSDFDQLDELTSETWKPDTYKSTMDFIARLRTYYNMRYQKANKEKQAIMQALTKTPEDRAEFASQRQEYENIALAILVKNMTTEHRLLEHDNMLVQKLYPIYHDPEYPAHALDFRAQFYQPTKHLAGQWIDTLIFNLGVMWCMSLLLFLTLYFDVLKRVITGFGR